MQLNQATDYAFRMVLYLASREPGTITPAAELAASLRVPHRFALKILHSLIRSGLVRSFRGAEGGFILAGPPDRITLLHVIEAMEGPLSIHRCLTEKEACSRGCVTDCPVHAALRRIQETMAASLAATTFAMLAAENGVQEKKTTEEEHSHG